MTHITYLISNINKSLEFEWLIDMLNREQFELSFILLNPHAKSELATYAESRGIAVHHIPFQSKKDYPRALWQCYGLLKKQQPQIAHAHLFDASLIGLLAAKFAGIKQRIYTRHHSSWHHVYFPKMVKYDRFINRLATHIVAISEGVKEILYEWEGVEEAKVSIIHHGIDTERFDQVTDAEIQALQSKYNPLGKSPVVGVISRYTEWKGVQYIIPAFKELLKEHPNALLILANAKGDYAKEIKSLLNELPNDSYCEIEFEPNLFALYKLFDVFVHTPIDAYSEAFGQIYIEALAAGIPSIFTKSGAALGFAKHLENCYVVDYCNADEILVGMRFLLTDRKIKLSVLEHGLKTVAASYHIEQKLRGLESLYTEIA